MAVNITQVGTGTLSQDQNFNTFDGRSVRTIDKATARPNDNIDPAMLKDSKEEMLRVLSTQDDIYESAMTEVEVSKGNGITLSDSIYYRISVGSDKATHTFGLVDPMTGDVISGPGSLLGFEKGQSTRHTQCIYNEVKDGVAILTHGMKYEYENAYNLFDKALPQLIKYWSEVEGRRKREALIRGYDKETVTDNMDFITQTQYLNPNWMINGDSEVTPDTVADLAAITQDVGVVIILTDATGATGAQVDGDYYKVTGANAAAWVSATNPVTDDLGMPIYNSDDEVFKRSVATAINNGCKGTPTIGLKFFDQIAYNAAEKGIFPLDDGNYLLTVPRPVYESLTSQEGVWGTYFTNTLASANGENSYDGKMIQYKTLKIVPDNRWVSCLVGGDNDSLTFGYLKPGNEDQRDKGAIDDTVGNASKTQLGMLHGKGALIERNEKDLYIKEELQDYQTIKGIGTFKQNGYNLNVIRSSYSDIVENRYSSVVVFPGVIL